MGYLTAKQFSEIWGITERRIIKKQGRGVDLIFHSSTCIIKAKVDTERKRYELFNTQAFA